MVFRGVHLLSTTLVLLTVSAVHSYGNDPYRNESENNESENNESENNESGGGDLAQLMAQEADFGGGVVVHLGSTAAERLAAIQASGAFVVQGLDPDPDNLAATRTELRSRGCYGPVSVDRWSPGPLPYADNMVNLLIAENAQLASTKEIMRVLAPEGVTYVRIDGKWQRLQKSRSAELDDWTHYLHGPDNNAVANDRVVGPPRHLQWKAEPKWTRHHDKMSSFSAMVSTGGRIFYILDEGSTASIYLPSRWALIARDAFNGKLLWKRSIGTWFSRFKGLKDGPADAPRRLVAAEGRVYATLDLAGEVHCLDAQSGETIRVYEGTNNAEELLLKDGVLYVLTGPGSLGDGRRMARPVERRTIMAIDATNGKPLWQHTDVVAALTMAVDDDGVYYFNFDAHEVVGLNRQSGAILWKSESGIPAPEQQRSFFASKLVVSDRVVLLASGEVSGMIKSGGGANKADTLTAMSTKTGATLWTAEHPPSGYSSPENLFVIDGVVWSGRNSNGRQDGAQIGRDLKTGKERYQFTPDKTSYWFHHRCYSGRATCKYILTSRTGIEFIDLKKQQWDLNHWVRGACLYGIMPANGLIYAPPSPCICYAESMLHGFTALTSETQVPVTPLPDSARLERGPAFDAAISGAASDADWPTYRGSTARSGRVDTDVPAQLETLWKQSLGDRLSSVTVAEGKVFVASIDDHTVHAISSDDGTPIWSYTVGGRVDSPPTYADGRLLFGSADGSVYCLRASDGAMVWRFQAAPADRRILVHEQLESVWPVHGSVLVREGIAYFVAGRSAFVDGGMLLYRVDVRTGAVISRSPIDDTNPLTGEDAHDTVKWLNMAVGRPDVLSTDGQRLFMRSQTFDMDGHRAQLGPEIDGRTEGTRQGGASTHLFCPTGFLDDTSFHRSYWLYAQTWSSGWNGYFVAGKHAPAGKIMAVGDDEVYVFGREPEYYRWTTPLEFRLFAAKKVWQAPPPRAHAETKKAKKKRRGEEAAAPISRADNYVWTTHVPILVRAMALANDALFIAGPADTLDERTLGRMGPETATDAILAQESALLGNSGAKLWSVSTADGTTLSKYPMDASPVFDGMAAAQGRLYIATTDGHIVCLGAK